MKKNTVVLYKRDNHARPYVIAVNGDIVFECPECQYAWEMIRDQLEYFGVNNPVKPDFIG